MCAKKKTVGYFITHRGLHEGEMTAYNIHANKLECDV